MISSTFTPTDFEPCRRAAAFGPPGAWVAAHGLPVGAALFDAAGPATATARYTSLGLQPRETLQLRLDDPADPFDALAAFAATDPRWARLPGPRPMIACALSYDLGRRVEALPSLARADGHLPDLWAARYPAVYVWDRHLAQGHIVAECPAAAEQLARRLAAGGPPPRPVRPGPAEAEMREADYRAALARIRGHIEAGDVYQVNYTLRFRAPLPGPVDPAPLFARLHARSPVPWAAALRLDAHRSVLSLSPERFLRWDADGRVETRPIKGTRPRHADPAADAAAAAELAADPKDRAEHLMIVDLERNDLGRVCQASSVQVPALLQPERYATVHHLVSTVTGQLQPGLGLAALLRAVFPGGSVTGAPKHRAMTLIEQLEPVRRGIYCGAVGYLDPAGGGDLNLPIRTAWTADDALWYQAGGGIVADSEPGAEWAEAWTKARAFLDAL